MSRLTDLIQKAKQKDAQLGADLEREFRVLSERVPFGLNFERHKPEAVELPQRPVRRGDKVRILPPRGSMKRGDQRLWRVGRIERDGERRLAHLTLIDGDGSTTVDASDCIVVAEFRDPIFPGLVSTGKVERGGDKPFNTVINGENFHVLEALTYTHKGKIDCIYIDPPYNTGAKDWKYNNDYVGDDDLYRHSKWLAFIERRLRVAASLLNPDDSVLIVTIDEKEYLRLGLLLEQVFTDAKIQMVSTLINPKGVVRFNEFTRTNEFVFVVMNGRATVGTEVRPGQVESVRWASLRRFEMSSRRHGPQTRPDQFYPIYVNTETYTIDHVGPSLPFDVKRTTVEDRPGCVTLFPLKPDGTEMVWGLTPATLKERLSKGYVKVTRPRGNGLPTLYYLTSGQIDDIADGKIAVTGKDVDGSVIVEYATEREAIPTTMWLRESHNAQAYGTGILSALLPGRRFPFPKSLYAVEDVLKLFIREKKEAVVLDFFAGSGTTAHATMRLNRLDGGRRQCISVTNNEVGVDELAQLRSKGLRAGDADWEIHGICDHITKPRIQAAIVGRTPEGEPVKGDYKFTDEFPLSVGLEENAEFFTLTYEAPLTVRHNAAFERIAPMLWMRAGSVGDRVESIPDQGWQVVEAYGVLFDLDAATAFCKAVRKSESLKIAYVVTDDARRFQSIVRRLPSHVEPVRLYESYLTNFEINMSE